MKNDKFATSIPIFKFTFPRLFLLAVLYLFFKFPLALLTYSREIVAHIYIV